MGRPREHDQRVAAMLLDAAEEIVDSGGVASLSVRAVAEKASTTTRAVYSLFGSKAGLVAALGARTFDLLGAGVRDLPVTGRPAGDLVEAGVRVFRQLAVTHPGLFQVGVQQTDVDPAVASEFIPAAEAAFAILVDRFVTLAAAGLLSGRAPSEAAGQFHALCEGLAALELRRQTDRGRAEDTWRDALSALIAGWAATAPSMDASEPGATTTA